MVDSLPLGVAAVLEPANMVGIVAGLILGILFGAIPGLNSITAVIMIMPFTYGRVSVKIPLLMDILRMRATAFGAAAIGTFIGILPGEGTTVACVLAYNEARRWSKRPEEFGNGTLEGVIAPETADNAVKGGAMAPTLGPRSDSGSGCWARAAGTSWPWCTTSCRKSPWRKSWP